MNIVLEKVDQNTSHLPFLPKHPSVYVSPVICPIETALILSKKRQCVISLGLGHCPIQYLNHTYTVQSELGNAGNISLILRPSHHTVIDGLQLAKVDGE